MCVAQQEAQRAQFFVEKAKQDQRQKIIQAEGEAEAAKMVSDDPPGLTESSRFIPLRNGLMGNNVSALPASALM